MTDHLITSEAELRAIMGSPVHELILAKSSNSLTEPMKKYIALSPLMCLSTHGTDGTSDISPRGDAPGFVHALDDKTLVRCLHNTNFCIRVLNLPVTTCLLTHQAVCTLHPDCTV